MDGHFIRLRMYLSPRIPSKVQDDQAYGTKSEQIYEHDKGNQQENDHEDRETDVEVKLSGEEKNEAFKEDNDTTFL